MSETTRSVDADHTVHPVDVDVVPALIDRNRLTCAFRPILAIPHILLVGGPAAFAISAGWRGPNGRSFEWGAGTGVLGAVAGVIALIAWFAIVFGGRYPEGLWRLAVFYLRWRVRAVAYLTLLRDEYPPFGDGSYPAELVLTPPTAARNRLTVAFRLILAIPQMIVVALLSIAWAVTTIIAWVSILINGTFPPSLYQFNRGMLRWTTRVEAYLLLLHDEYPPFSLEAR
jgi:uncharacterized protein DUF4389